MRVAACARMDMVMRLALENGVRITALVGREVKWIFSTLRKFAGQDFLCFGPLPIKRWRGTGSSLLLDDF